MNGTILITESEEEIKSLLRRVKEDSDRASLTPNIKKKAKIMASGSITSLQIEGEKLEVVTDFLFWVPESLRMVTANINPEDDCFLAGKL